MDEYIRRHAGDSNDSTREIADDLHNNALAAETLAHIRANIDKQIKNTYLTSAQAPVGVKPVLKAWM